MDRSLQELVWAKLPLNEMQRQDLLNNLVAELSMDTSPDDSKQTLEMNSQIIKKRKRTNEQCENLHHMR
jgi:hypothetical protein